MSRARLDQELVRRGLFPTRSAARNAIRIGSVRVAGTGIPKPASRVDSETLIEIDDDAVRFVSRGAYKLEAALDRFPVSIAGRTAVDIGSSTGGFTQVLLEAGASAVTAVDVGRDQLHASLRRDPRVAVREGTNIRDVALDDLGGPFAVVTADLSFISLRVVAGDLARLGDDDTDWIVLVKPQFEVGRRHLGKDGVVRDGGRRGQAAVDVIDSFSSEGLVSCGIMRSPLLGGSGNAEALLWLRRAGEPIVSLDAFKVLADD
jgi:23S rRNA (cytidine1920-2'-O)/16S rRNA (cytidine1409-2'-O)-methyltransferase